MTLEEKIDYILAFDDSINRILIKYSLLRTEELILNYTNLNKLPKGVDFTHIEMTIIHLEKQKTLMNSNKSNTHEGIIGSIQEGDTTVKMATVRDNETSLDKSKAKMIFEDKLMNDFRVSLRKYRNMRW